MLPWFDISVGFLLQQHGHVNGSMQLFYSQNPFKHGRAGRIVRTWQNLCAAGGNIFGAKHIGWFILRSSHHFYSRKRKVLEYAHHTNPSFLREQVDTSSTLGISGKTYALVQLPACIEVMSLLQRQWPASVQRLSLDRCYKGTRVLKGG